MLERLPLWHMTHLRPANFDSESLTVIEQTARVYAKMNELIDSYNEYVTNLNQSILKHETDVSEVIENYTTMVTGAFEAFKSNIEEEIAIIKDENETSKTVLTSLINDVDTTLKEYKDQIDEDLRTYAQERLEQIVDGAYGAFYYDASSEEIGYRTMITSEYDITYDSDLEQINILANITSGANETENYERIQALDARLKAMGG